MLQLLVSESLTTTRLLLDVDLGVPLMFIGAGEFESTDVTAEWLLTSVCSHVGDEVVTAAKAEQACVTLEWLLACVNAHVTGQLIITAKALVTVLDRTTIGPFTQWRF